jgi:5-hydroxyisourate hydrolase-like protein (transthyretin family)
VPIRYQWAGAEGPAMGHEWTVKLDAATPIGGIVQDEDGKPIVGVDIAFHYVADKNAPVSISIYDRGIKTDANGRWECDFAPAELPSPESYKFRIYLVHRDYLSDQWRDGHFPMPLYPQPSAQDLQAKTAVYVMKRESDVKGQSPAAAGLPPAAPSFKIRVIDSKTLAPIPDVQVKLIQAGASSDGKESKYVTGDDGRCRAAANAWSLSQAVFFRDGYVPMRYHWSGNNGPSFGREWTVKLDAATPIGGVVLDVEGKPIAGVDIAFHYVLPEDAPVGINIYDRGIKTDANGRWECDFAPAELPSPESHTFRIYLSRPGYLSDEWHDGFPIPRYPQPSAKDLQAKRAVYVMAPEPAVSGGHGF